MAVCSSAGALRQRASRASAAATGTGAAAFEKNWGFVPAPLRYWSKSDGPARTVNPLNPKYALMVRTWKRLPLPLANTLGPWIARGLG